MDQQYHPVLQGAPAEALVFQQVLLNKADRGPELALLSSRKAQVPSSRDRSPAVIAPKALMLVIPRV